MQCSDINFFIREDNISCHNKCQDFSDIIPRLFFAHLTQWSVPYRRGFGPFMTSLCPGASGARAQRSMGVVIMDQLGNCVLFHSCGTEEFQRELRNIIPNLIDIS